jgi:hypothetical protein
MSAKRRSDGIDQRSTSMLVGVPGVAMNADVLAILRAFAGICIFQRAPQDIPRSSALLAATTLANMALTMIICSLSAPFGKALLRTTLDAGLMFVAVAILLSLLSYRHRLVQTLTALMGSGAILSGVALLTMFLAVALPQDLGLAILPLNFLLSLLVNAHILRHAISTWFPVGLLFAFGYAILDYKSIALVEALLGAAPT